MKKSPTIVQAKNLREDDWFKLAGQLYVVARVQKNLYNDRIIKFYNGALEPDDIVEMHTLIVPRYMLFKIHNR